MPTRRSCGFVGMSRNGYRYRPVPRDDSQLLGVLRDYSRAHPCEGYRKAMAVARKELGEPVNHKKVERLWREEGLSVPRKRRRRRRGKGIPRAPVAEKTGHVWTMDFAEDSSQDGRKLRFLAITDEFTRECLVITTGRSCRARDVKHTLEGLFRTEGRPDHMRCDNGPEFTAGELSDWLEERGIGTDYIDPGKPWQNGKAESLNSSFRRECLDHEVFYGVEDAAIIVERWRRHYNETRPHGSLAYLSPAEFKGRLTEQAQGALPPGPQDLSHGPITGGRGKEQEEQVRKSNYGSTSTGQQQLRPREEGTPRDAPDSPSDRPHHGAQVASQRCPILQVGARDDTRGRHNGQS